MRLLRDVASADRTGAQLVGDAIAPGPTEVGQPAEQPSVMRALALFHSDEDCAVVFALLGKLEPSQSLISSIALVKEQIHEALRYTGIHRDNLQVQEQAARFIAMLASSTEFPASDLLAAGVVEVLLLGAMRHQGDKKLTAPTH